MAVPKSLDVIELGLNKSTFLKRIHHGSLWCSEQFIVLNDPTMSWLSSSIELKFLFLMILSHPFHNYFLQFHYRDPEVLSITMLWMSYAGCFLCVN